MRSKILKSAIIELQRLANKAGKQLSDKTLKNLFIRKKAYQKDWPQLILRKEATLIAGATVMAIGNITEEELLFNF